MIRREQGGEIQGCALGGREFCEGERENRTEALFVVVTACDGFLLLGGGVHLFQVFQAHLLQKAGVALLGMLAEIGADDFHAQGEAAETARDFLRRALRLGEGAVFSQQAEGVLEGQLAEGEPMDVVMLALSLGRAEAGSGQQMKLWAENADEIGLLRREQGEVGHVVQHEKDAAHLPEPLAQGLSDGADVEVE